MMQTNREERACELARWIVENNATVRAAAKRFGISKSTVHKDLSERLRQIDRLLYEGRTTLVRVLKDGWTTVTADGKLSAHYENTVLITDGEPEILTVTEGL